ncbi:PAS domain-containing protein [Thiocystis violascens]|uniref:PAS domain-containing protein n=1 Tax=Thiocystis violascens TaxID=73141 RepID=UPI00022C331A|nr:PAS domain-containing protein [Thiocystis violascens]
MIKTAQTPPDAALRREGSDETQVPDGRQPRPVNFRENEPSESRQAKQRLLESEERHRLFFEQSRDAMMTLAPPSWRFTTGNPAACATYGVRDEAKFVALGPWDVSP